MKRRDEAEGEEHRGGVARACAPDGGEPAKHFGGGGERDGHGGDGEGGAGEGVEAGDEHVVSPEQDAEEADEQGGGDHGAVGEDFAVAEVREEHGGEAEAGEDGDVDLGMSEEPEEMEPEERAAVRRRGVEDAVDEVAGGEEEAGSGVAVAEEEQDGGEQDGEGDDAEERGGEPSPDGEGEAFPGHPGAAVADDGGEGVDGAYGGGDGEEGDGDEPEIHAEGLAGAGARDCAEGRVGRPAGDGRASGDEGGAQQCEERNRGEPEAGGVETGKAMLAGADLRGEDEVAEAGLRRGGEDEEEHEVPWRVTMAR